MSTRQDFATHIVDLLEPCGYGEVRCRLTGITNARLYLKADAESREIFVTEDDRKYQLSRYLAADNFCKDPVACLRWGEQVLNASSRKPARHRVKKA